MNIDYRNDKPMKKIGKTLLATCLAIAGVGAAHAQTTLNFANLAGGWTGDGGQAKAAYLQNPGDVVFDAAGNMYVSQFWTNRIRKITPGGVITTVVGGNAGFGGDNGPASKALIDRPMGLAIDAAGNLYFADSGNRRVRRIAPNGTITTVAGNGNFTATGDGGQATAAAIGEPSGLAIDKNGNLYFSDRRNNYIRKVTSAGVISTYAGNGTAGLTGNDGPAKSASLNGPDGIDVDAAGNLYIADVNNKMIRRVTPTGTISAFMNASYPINVAVDKAGNVYATSDCVIIKRKTDGTIVNYGTLSPLYCVGKTPDGTLYTSAGFGYVDGIAFDAAGNIFFADPDFARIAKISVVDNKVYTHAGVDPVLANGTLAPSAKLQWINALSVADDGAVMFNEYMYSHRIRKL
ncbi:MAG: hypothetical protein HOQ01_09930, partial [Lysobacter sp.]|nr:hypothetical protein [Lysobacter sp.]